MSSRRELLTDSRDSWAESAASDRKQFIGSFVISGLGLVLAGVGVATILSGDVAGGALELTFGSGVAAASGREGLSEVQSFAEMTAKTAVRQAQLDRLSE